MAKLLKLRRGTTTQHGSFTGAEGEVTVDTDKETLVVHDGSTAGGHPVAAEDMANVSSASIAGRLGTDSIATSKIAAGALPTDVTIASANIVNGTIATDDIGGQQITTAKIADDAVTAAKIAAGAVGQTEIATGGVDATELAADAVRAVKIQDGAVISSKIAADAVNGTKIADDSINSEHYVDGSIDTAHIADDAVTQAKMADNAIGTSQLANNAVYTAAIQNDAVTYDKIQNVAQDRILGRQSAGGGSIEELNAANVRTLINVENGATADQTGAEIATALNGQNVYTTGNIGRDTDDYISFVNGTYMDITIAGSNEFRFESDGDFHADGDVYAFSTTVASDENLKKDITIVGDAVSKVEAIKGVTFKWKKSDAESAGVIAQDVEKVLPEVVKTVQDPDGNPYKAVNYSGITSVLIEAVKDLSARVKALEAK
tara:strand:+ start:811 stop:2106 length:1296 start_codon:yes stop_codon:yes gene_type:complete